MTDQTPPRRFGRLVRQVPVPNRYSVAWWTLMSTIAVVLAAATAWMLYALNVVSEPLWIVVAAGVAAVAGDVVAALGMEAMAPTRIAIGPNERTAAGSRVRETAVVVSGFEGSAEGKVSARGEIWAARSAGNQPLSLSRGTKVGIVDRDGLTLLVHTR